MKGDHEDSPYFAHLDYYHLQNTETLSIIPKFHTYQQTTQYTCGPVCILMVLHHYGEQQYDEMMIAQLAEAKETCGLSPQRMVRFFQQIGWHVESSLDGVCFPEPEQFTAWVLNNLQAGTPILVDWIDWDGHWQVIIGYDTMGTAYFGDDVLIVADPYDTSDHCQDGYMNISAERFFYMWHEGVCCAENPLKQPWVIAKPNL